jgi:hypothetical protein
MERHNVFMALVPAETLQSLPHKQERESSDLTAMSGPIIQVIFNAAFPTR